MRCPICGSTEDKVIESRQIAYGYSVRRRRKCTACGNRFTSYEHIEHKQLMVIKKDDRREPFNVEKLAGGIQRACEKRPISQVVINELIHDIEEKCTLLAGDSYEISSDKIGEMVVERIKPIDAVAYIRFASVYKNFDDVIEFVKEIEKIQNK